jgi:hypothetical protein
MLSGVYVAMTGVRTHNLIVVIGTNCTCSCKSNRPRRPSRISGNSDYKDSRNTFHLLFLSFFTFSSTNKTDHPDITKILLKVALNTITIPIVHHISVVGRPIPCKNIHFFPFENYPLITLNVVLFVELQVSVDYRSFGCRVHWYGYGV